MHASLHDIFCLKSRYKPLLGLDLGEKRIGIAVSDGLWMTANSLEVIENQKFTKVAQHIKALCDEYKASALVIGLPKNMDGSHGPRVQSIQDFARNFSRLYPDIPYIFWDERLSTVAAETVLLDADMTRSKRKKVIDKIAAAYILQGFLDRLQNYVDC